MSYNEHMLSTYVLYTISICISYTRDRGLYIYVIYIVLDRKRTSFPYSETIHTQLGV